MGEKEVPHTILEEIINHTISQLIDKSDFDQKTIEDLEKILKTGKTNPNQKWS